MIRPVRKAVFPVAGLGTRSLPATKAVPKEMLCVVDKPVIQFAVEEAAAAGIEEFIFVTSRGKSALEDHFDSNFELESALLKRGKTDELAASRAAELPVGGYAFVRQPVPLGLGHAVLCAQSLIGDEPFAVLLPDDIFKGEPGVLKQMMQVYETLGGNLMAVQEVAPELTSRYGILAIGEDDGAVVSVTGLVEKPAPEKAPSNLSIVGRYILQPEVFRHLLRKKVGAGGEIQLTDAMAKLIGTQPFHGVRFDGDRYDCGDKAGFVAANVAFALARPSMAKDLKETLSALLRDAD